MSSMDDHDISNGDAIRTRLERPAMIANASRWVILSTAAAASLYFSLWHFQMGVLLSLTATACILFFAYHATSAFIFLLSPATHLHRKLAYEPSTFDIYARLAQLRLLTESRSVLGVTLHIAFPYLVVLIASHLENVLPNLDVGPALVTLSGVLALVGGHFTWRFLSQCVRRKRGVFWKHFVESLPDPVEPRIATVLICDAVHPSDEDLLDRLKSHTIRLSESEATSVVTTGWTPRIVGPLFGDDHFTALENGFSRDDLFHIYHLALDALARLGCADSVVHHLQALEQYADPERDPRQLIKAIEIVTNCGMRHIDTYLAERLRQELVKRDEYSKITSRSGHAGNESLLDALFVAVTSAEAADAVTGLTAALRYGDTSLRNRAIEPLHQHLVEAARMGPSTAPQLADAFLLDRKAVLADKISATTQELKKTGGESVFIETLAKRLRLPVFNVAKCRAVLNILHHARSFEIQAAFDHARCHKWGAALDSCPPSMHYLLAVQLDPAAYVIALEALATMDDVRVIPLVVAIMELANDCKAKVSGRVQPLALLCLQRYGGDTEGLKCALSATSSTGMKSRILSAMCRTSDGEIVPDRINLVIDFFDSICITDGVQEAALELIVEARDPRALRYLIRYGSGDSTERNIRTLLCEIPDELNADDLKVVANLPDRVEEVSRYVSLSIDSCNDYVVEEKDSVTKSDNAGIRQLARQALRKRQLPTEMKHNSESRELRLVVKCRCGKTYRFAESRRGKSMRCRSCNRTIVIPEG